MDDKGKMSDINWKALGIRIKESRKRKGFTIDKLSALADITSNFLARIEGNNAHASLTTVYRIAVELDCGIDYLLSDSLTHLSNTQLLNLNTLNQTEQNFILDVVRGLKKCEAEIIEHF
ncbi:MAG: helix-turn-helix domain-containing protein [Oscillospiraceae bacterium]|nr:helix-turn-helix domain-containing protein [Oscillospiraceae bacterium]